MKRIACGTRVADLLKMGEVTVIECKSPFSIEACIGERVIGTVLAERVWELTWKKHAQKFAWACLMKHRKKKAKALKNAQSEFDLIERAIESMEEAI